MLLATTFLLLTNAAFGGTLPDLGHTIAFHAKVRATTAGSKTPLEATFLEQRGDSLFLQPLAADGVVPLAIADLSRLDVSSELRTKTGTGAWIGLASGALFGALLGWAGASEGDETGGAAFGALVFGGLGAALGGWIGSSVEHDHWVEVYPEWERQPSNRTRQRTSSKQE
jgi:hypothetical protein